MYPPSEERRIQETPEQRERRVYRGGSIFAGVAWLGMALLTLLTSKNVTTIIGQAAVAVVWFVVAAQPTPAMRKKLRIWGLVAVAVVILATGLLLGWR